MLQGCRGVLALPLVAIGIASLCLVPGGRAMAQTPSPGGASPLGNLGAVPAGDERSPRLTVGDKGDVFRIWQRTADLRVGGGTIIVDVARPKDSWETLLQIQPQGKGVSAQEGDLAIGPSGEMAMAYQWWRDAPRSKQIRLAWSHDMGKQWVESPGPIDGAGKAFEPKLTWARDKSLVVVWSDERRGGRLFDVYTRRSPDGGKTWEPEQLLSQFPRNLPGDLHARPRILSDGQDRLWVIWVGVRSRRSSIYLNRSEDAGKTWSAPQELTSDSQSVFGQSLHRAGDRMLLVWHDTRTGHDRLYSVTSSDAGKTWTPPVRIDHLAADDKPVEATSPTVVMSPDGHALVAWQDMRNGREDIFLSTSSDAGRTWSREDQRMDMDEPGTGISRYPDLAVAPDGRVALAWEDDRAGREGIYLRIRSSGTNPQWGPEILVAPPSGQVGARIPDVVWVPSGLYVTWEKWDYTTGLARTVKTISSRVLGPDGR
jgi:BNR repeat-like domain